MFTPQTLQTLLCRLKERKIDFKSRQVQERYASCEETTCRTTFQRNIELVIATRVC